MRTTMRLDTSRQAVQMRTALAVVKQRAREMQSKFNPSTVLGETDERCDVSATGD